MTAISGFEIACWDLIGKSCGEPVYKLLGGQARDRLTSYANGWYGGAQTPAEYAAKAREVVARGYRGMKFDPFGTAWKELTHEQMRDAERIVADPQDGPATRSFPSSCIRRRYRQCASSISRSSSIPSRAGRRMTRKLMRRI